MTKLGKILYYLGAVKKTRANVGNDYKLRILHPITIPVLIVILILYIVYGAFKYMLDFFKEVFRQVAVW